MELKVSSLKREGLSPADCVSDPEEKEVSDEDDDDRNHKHRRSETLSQSSERESLEPDFSRSYRKHNKLFENGHPFRQNESAASESWKNYSNASLERDFSTKFDKRRPGLMPLSRVPMDMNQRMRPNQYFHGELGTGRGRGRGRGRYPGSWSQQDSRFSPIDLASQIIQQGPIAPSLFPGRGLANVSNPQGVSWNAFGLIPGIPNGGLDTLHPIAFPGTLRPLNSSLNMGIPRQRCRDFEERGFCLRGDMCPMEHGVNRIVVEDVQSLSQFNLSVSLPSSQLAGTAAGPGGLPSVSAPSNPLMNSKPTQGRSSKSGMVDDTLGLNGDYPSMSGADFYDPDQPLWNNSGPETSSGILLLHSPKNDETESLMGVEPSDHVGSQGNNSSVWGRIHTSKKRLDLKEKNDLAVSSSDYLEIESKDDQDALTNVQGTSRQGKHFITGDSLRHVDLSPKSQIDSTRNSVRNPSQKALRTLFVNSIPQKSNKRESLLSHFQKFGEVIDIYIPLNSERAFVQFSKREEAEAALRAPDAVMGNRFIKLWWANRDRIPDDGMNTSINASGTSCGGTAASGLAHPSAGNSGNENLHPVSSKGAMSTPHDPSVTAPDNQRVILANGPKVPPPSQKKLESLEQLKEDIRKKQELLDQKRNDFRRKLDKLAKQASGVKGEAVTEPSGKRKKVGTLADVAKLSAPSSSDPTAAVAHLHADISVDKNNAVENVVSASPKTATSQQDPTISKQSIFPLGPVGPSILMNRYKLDNRPRSFRIITPLPAGLRNVAALKEYFSSYGDISAVELEDGEPHCDDNIDESEFLENSSVRLTFTTRQSAEKAFLNGKYWQGNSLKFMWVTSSTSSNDTGEKKKSSAPKDAVDAYIQPVEGLTRFDSVEVLGTGSGEHENSGQDGGVDNTEIIEVSQPCEALISGERESPKKELCPSPKREHSPTSISGGEESIQQGSDPTATSEQKQSPNGIIC